MEAPMGNQNKSETGLRIWQPNGELEQLGRYFEDVFGRSLLPAWTRTGPEAEAWAPKIEVIEQKERFLVKAELPGVEEKDINLSITGNVLTIEGEKQTSAESDKEGYHYSETSYGSFSRSLTIPSSVDMDKIEANSEKGVLEIFLPKMREAQPKKISVKARKEVSGSVKPPEKKTSK
jgi:HSP20 family protein